MTALLLYTKPNEARVVFRWLPAPQTTFSSGWGCGKWQWGLGKAGIRLSIEPYVANHSLSMPLVPTVLWDLFLHQSLAAKTQLTTSLAEKSWTEIIYPVCLKQKKQVNSVLPPTSTHSSDRNQRSQTSWIEPEVWQSNSVEPHNLTQALQ